MHIARTWGRTLVLGVIGLAASRAGAAQAEYTVTDLGRLTMVSAMNEAGDVVGTLQTADHKTHAFLFRGGRMTDLGTLGGDSSTAQAISPTGVVVGTSAIHPAPGHAGPSAHAFIYAEGRMQDLTAQGAVGMTSATGINARGAIVGLCDYLQAAVFADGTVQRLPPLVAGGYFDFLVHINRAGDIVGAAQAADGHEHAFLYSHARMQDLGLTYRGGGVAAAINDGGDVVGTRGGHAFLYHAGQFRDLGALPDRPGTTATAINNRGDVVGVASKPVNDTRSISPGVIDQGILVDWHAALFQDDHWIDLNDEVDLRLTGLKTLTEALAINDHGQIAGQASGPDGYHGVVLTPIGK